MTNEVTPLDTLAGQLNDLRAAHRNIMVDITNLTRQHTELKTELHKQIKELVDIIRTFKNEYKNHEAALAKLYRDAPIPVKTKEEEKNNKLAVYAQIALVVLATLATVKIMTL